MNTNPCAITVMMKDDNSKIQVERTAGEGVGEYLVRQVPVMFKKLFGNKRLFFNQRNKNPNLYSHTSLCYRTSLLNVF